MNKLLRTISYASICRLVACGLKKLDEEAALGDLAVSVEGGIAGLSGVADDQTTSPISVSGTLSRSGRVMNGGAFEVVHNLAQFTATYVPNNLTWTGVCCHPASGSLNVTYTGSITGSATVTFTGCGDAPLAKDGLSRNISINYCD